MSFEEENAVKLLVTFPSDANLTQIASDLTENYLFIQHIRKISNSQLLISFDSMSELLEIDFIRDFGALSAKVKNSNSFCKEISEQIQVLTSIPDNSSVRGSSTEIFGISKNQVEGARRLRLTSIDNQIDLNEEQIKKLSLFDNQSTSCKGEKSLEKIDNLEQQLQQQQSKNEQSLWGPIVNGVVLTSLIVGGMKAIKLFFR